MPTPAAAQKTLKPNWLAIVLGAFGAILLFLSERAAKKTRIEPDPSPTPTASPSEGAAKLFYEGKAAQALAIFEKTNSTNQLQNAANLCNQADCLFYLRKNDAALAKYLEAATNAEKGPILAKIHDNRGCVFLAMAKPDDAIAEFEKAIELGGLELPRALNNRGAARRAQHKDKEAVADFVAALGAIKDTSDDALPPVRLEVAMGYKEAGLDALIRTRYARKGLRKETAVLRAAILKNLGYANLALGDAHAAVSNFRAATEAFAALIEDDGESDLTSRLAACADGVAIALAESAKFSEAIPWAEKAVALAAPNAKAEFQSHLVAFQTGKPWRHSPANSK